MKWILYSIVDLLVSLLAFPLAPFIVLATDDAGNSPLWCWPWLTFDNPIDGDGGHLERWAGRPVWMRRVAWLWRNKGYNFSRTVTGVTVDGPVTIVGGTPFWQRGGAGRGWCFARAKGCWMLFFFFPWSSNYALRGYLGWKLRDKIDNPDVPDRAMLVQTVNPLKSAI